MTKLLQITHQTTRHMETYTDDYEKEWNDHVKTHEATYNRENK